jgi:hypothetical protein
MPPPSSGWSNNTSSKKRAWKQVESRALTEVRESFASTCFGHYWPSSEGVSNAIKELLYTCCLNIGCYCTTLNSCKSTYLPSASTLVYCLAYSSTLKMEATCSSEKSVDFQRITRRYIPEDRTVQFSRGFVFQEEYLSSLLFSLKSIKYN